MQVLEAKLGRGQFNQKHYINQRKKQKRELSEQHIRILCEMTFTWTIQSIMEPFSQLHCKYCSISGSLSESEQQVGSTLGVVLCFALLSSHQFLNSDVKKQEPCLPLKIVDEVSFYHLIFKEEIQKFVFYYNFKFLIHLIQLLDVTLASCMNISASTCGRTFNINGSNTKSEFHFPRASLLLSSLACMHLSVGAFISA